MDGEYPVFASQADFDRMASAVRWAERQQGNVTSEQPAPNPSGAGSLTIRVNGGSIGSDIFTTTPSGTTSTTTTPSSTTTPSLTTTAAPAAKFGPYPARFCYRNVEAKTAEDVWFDGDRCLVQALNGEELKYGCRYEGFASEVPDADGRILVLVTGPVQNTPCGKVACGCIECTQAAPEFEFYVNAARVSGDDTADSKVKWLEGDWTVLHSSGCIWRNGTNEVWKLFKDTSAWTLVGKGSDGITVTLTSSDFSCTTGGTFTGPSVSAGFWVGDATIVLTARGPITGCPTTTTGPCPGDCFWNFAQAGRAWTLTSNTCQSGCKCFAPAWCPATTAGDVCTHTLCGHLADHQPAPNCTTPTTTTPGPTTTPNSADYFCFMYTSTSSCGTAGQTFCGQIPPYNIGGGTSTCGGGVFFNYSQVSGPHASSGACAAACSGATTTTPSPTTTTTPNPCFTSTSSGNPLCHGGFATYYCGPDHVWYFRDNPCPPECPANIVLPPCDAARSCQLFTFPCSSPPPPPPPTCTGTCFFVGAPGIGWIKDPSKSVCSTNASYPKASSCYCDFPPGQPAACGNTATTACYFHDNDPCNGTTTTTPSGCSGKCIFGDNGSHVWTVLSTCPGCACRGPTGTPSGTCDRQLTDCFLPTTTTTTTPSVYTCYYCQNYSGGLPSGSQYAQCTSGVPGFGFPPGGFASCFVVSTHSVSDCESKCTTTTPTPTTTTTPGPTTTTDSCFVDTCGMRCYGGPNWVPVAPFCRGATCYCPDPPWPCYGGANTLIGMSCVTGTTTTPSPTTSTTPGDCGTCYCFCANFGDHTQWACSNSCTGGCICNNYNGQACGSYGSTVTQQCFAQPGCGNICYWTCNGPDLVWAPAGNPCPTGCYCTEPSDPPSFYPTNTQTTCVPS